MKKYLFLLVALACMAKPSLGQSTTAGDISGTLTDPTGAVIPNAKVTVSNVDTGETRSATTGASGSYRLSLLVPGSYKVTATAPGFNSVTNTVTVSAGAVSSDDLKLAVGQGNATTVEVTAAPESVNTENADVTTTFTAEEVQAMPNPGNDLTFVAQTAPGSVMNTGTASGGYGNFSSFGISGLSNMFTLDGGYENDPFLNLNNTGASNLTLGNNEVDTVTIVSPAYSAQFGGLGGAQVNEITKSGTNRVHGNLSYYWDGRALNSNDWFNKQNQVFYGQKNIPTFVNANQWAARIGGPAVKDKLFWFVDTEGIRATTPAQGQVYVPTARAVTCATTGDCTALNNAATADCNNNPNSNCVGPFSGAPASQLPLVKTIMNVFRTSPYRPAASAISPDPNDVALETYYATARSFLSEWLLTARVDYHFSDKDSFFIHYKQDHGIQPTYTDLIDPRFNSNSPQPAWEGQMSEVHNFTPNLVNQLLLTGNYYSAPFTNTNNYLGIAPFAFINIDSDLSTYGGEDFAFPQGRRVAGYQVIDDLSWVHGSNTLRLGYNIRRNNVTVLDEARTVAPLAEGSEEGFFAGSIDYLWSQNFVHRGEQPVSLYGEGAYVQDEFKVSPTLTLIAGVRVERNSNPVCHTRCFQTLAYPLSLSQIPTGAASQTAPYNAAYPGGLIVANRYRALTGYQKAAIEPRVSFNWAPASHTVIRGGFGLFADSFPGLIAQRIMDNAPNNFRATVYGTIGGGANDLNLDPSTAGSGGQIAAASNAQFQSGFTNGTGSYKSINTYLNANLGSPYSVPSFTTTPNMVKYPTYDEWSMAIAQQIGRNTNLEVLYVGNHGYHEPVVNGGFNLSSSKRNAPSTFFPLVPTSRPVTAFATLTNVYSGASSNFNGVVFDATQRAHGFTLKFNYEWSHALDEVSNGGLEPFAPDAGDSSAIANPYDLHAQYGNADYDVRQNTTASFVYDLPNFFHTWQNLAGGFEFSGVVVHQTGLPYSITESSSSVGYTTTAGKSASTSFSNGAVLLYARQLNNTFDHHCGGGVHALLPDGTNPHPCNFVSSFGQPTDFAQQRRNSLRGPAYTNVNFGVFKSFTAPHYEFVKLKVGAQFFNLFNHPNFQNPAHTLKATPYSDYGAISSTVGAPTSILGSVGGADATPRLIQLHGEITF